MSEDTQTRKSDNSPLPLSEEELSLSAIQAEVDKIQSSGVAFIEKLDLIIQLKSRLAPAILKECFNKTPNPDVSLIASRASTILKNTADLIIKKRELEVSDELNPYSPKFQKAFQFFLEVINASLIENSLDEVTVNNVFSTIAGKLVGWEDLLMKQLKGLSGKANEEITNPFLQKFKEETKKASPKPRKKREPKSEPKVESEDVSKDGQNPSEVA